MSSIGKYILMAVGLGLAIGGLFFKNLLQQKSIGTISKQELLRILRIIRKQKYSIFKRIATLALNISQQTRNNINPQMIEQFISGPQSPIKMNQDIEKITERVCALVGTNIGVYNHTLQQLKNDQDILNLIREAQTDYRITLSGKLPAYKVNIPESLTKDKFYLIQNQITKSNGLQQSGTYIQQLNLFKKLKQYSQIQLQQNPALLQQISNPQAEQEQILVEEGLGSETEPPFAVYEAATVKYYNDPNFKNRIKIIQQGYQKILKKHAHKIQSKTISDRELNELEDEIVYFDPELV